MGILKNYFLTFFLGMLLYGCNGEMLESLEAPKFEGGKFCPGNRDDLGNCPFRKESAWDFTNPSDYNFNSNYVEVSNGRASLKTVDQTFSGTDFNSGNHVGTYVSGNNVRLSPSVSAKLADSWTPKFSNIVTYFSMDLSSGRDVPSGSTLTADIGSSGTVLTGSAGGAGTNFTKGRVGQSLILDGQGDYVNIAHPFSIVDRNQNFTYQFWFKADSFSSQPQADVIMGTRSGSWARSGILLSNTGNIFYNWRQSSTEVGSARAADPIVLGNWYHIVVVADASLETISLYINGVLKDTTSYPMGTIMTSDWRLGIGQEALADSIGGPWANWAHGKIDEVAIWDEALTSSEISTIYSRQSQIFANDTSLSEAWTPYWDNIVSYWKMDGNWQDSSGNGNHGTANGDATFDSDAKVGSQSGTFDGTGDYVSSSSVDLSSMTEGSIGVWVKSSITSTSNDRLIEIGSTANRVGLILDSSQVLHLFILSSSSMCLDLTTSEKINDGSWHHVAGTYGSDGAEIFIDGRQVAISSSDCSGAFMPVSSSVFVGQFVGGGNYEWNGSLDDAAIWNKKLSLEDIKQIYNRQKQKYAGHYDSPVIDLGTSGSWTNLDAVTSLPFGKEIVAQASESSSDYPFISGDYSNGLVGYWPFNEASLNSVGGEDFDDKSVNSSNGNEMGGVSLENGITGSSVKFDGVDDTITASGMDLSGTDVVSISFWMKWDETNQNDLIILEYSSNFNGSFGGFLINANPAGQGGANRLSFALRGNGGYNLANFDRPDDGEWHHYAAVIDKGEIAANEVIPYIDGKPIGYTKSHTGENTNNFGNENLFFMARNASSLFGQGSLDEVALWSRALSPTEIQQLYRRGANRVKYQVKICVDSSCICKEFKRGSTDSNDCDGDGTPNSTDTDNEDTLAEFIGPGGDGVTAYSELFNRTPGDLTFNCSTGGSDLDPNNCDDSEISLVGDTSPTSPSFTFSDMATNATPNNNRYFQYRVIMEAEENSACGGEACLPELTSVEIGPTDRYYGGSPVVSPTTPISYNSLKAINFTESGNCSISYQLSGDGSTYYYHNGSAWVTAGSEDVSLSTSGNWIGSNITSFPISSGNLYFKAFMTSDTSQACTLDQISTTSQH